MKAALARLAGERKDALPALPFAETLMPAAEASVQPSKSKKKPASIDANLHFAMLQALAGAKHLTLPPMKKKGPERMSRKVRQELLATPIPPAFAAQLVKLDPVARRSPCTPGRAHTRFAVEVAMNQLPILAVLFSIVLASSSGHGGRGVDVRAWAEATADIPPIRDSRPDAYRCALVPDPGRCKAAIPKFYFDQSAQTCREFIWGGCGGTVPFDTLSQCQSVCER